MPTSLTELTYRVGLIAETLKAEPIVGQSIVSRGELSRARLDAGIDLAHKAFELTHHLEEAHEDHTAHTQAQRAVIELDSAHQTMLGIFVRALGAEPPREIWDPARGADIQHKDYSWTIVMRAWRTISFFRCHSDLWERLESKRRVEDDLLRTRTLLRKTTKLLSKLHRQHDGSTESADLRDQLEAWLGDFSLAATNALAAQPAALGLLGIAPEGIARPLGGTAYDVLRHQRAQTTPPEPQPAGPCPQWTPGAAGNRENYWEQG